jgi:hypothetical protein
MDTTTLPPGIHAHVVTGRNVVSGTLMERGVVWADRTYRVCGTCREPVPYAVEACPVALDEFGSPQEYSQAHCDLGGACGTWQSVLWADCGPTSDEIEEAAQALATRRTEALGTERESMTAALRSDLAAALARIASPEPGETAEDAATQVTTGSDTAPGVYFDSSTSGEWCAWDYDPQDDSETVTVYASDLA